MREFRVYLPVGGASLCYWDNYGGETVVYAGYRISSWGNEYYIETLSLTIL